MDKKEEVKSLINSLSIKKSWLAGKLGMKSHTLSFILNEDTKLDEHLYHKIIEAIDSYQYELNLFSEESTSDLNLFDDEKLHLGIGERIRVFAKKKYGTLKKLADAMNISPQQLHQYISGKREPGSKILIKLLKLGCDINWLLGGAESIESYKIYKLESELRKLQDGFTQISNVIHRLDHGN